MSTSDESKLELEENEEEEFQAIMKRIYGNKVMSKSKKRRLRRQALRRRRDHNYCRAIEEDMTEMSGNDNTKISAKAPMRRIHPNVPLGHYAGPWSIAMLAQMLQEIVLPRRLAIRIGITRRIIGFLFDAQQHRNEVARIQQEWRVLIASKKVIISDADRGIVAQRVRGFYLGFIEAHIAQKRREMVTMQSRLLEISRFCE